MNELDVLEENGCSLPHAMDIAYSASATAVRGRGIQLGRVILIEVRHLKGQLRATILATVLSACEDAKPRVMIEPAAATMHSITLTVSDDGQGALHLAVQNNRPEPITAPGPSATLLMVAGAPTFELGPRELYVPNHAGLHVRSPQDDEAIGPGQTWSTNIDLTDAIETPDHKLTTTERELLTVPIEGQWFTTLFVRVWVFPQVNLPGRGSLQWLPYLVLREPPHPQDDPDFWFPHPSSTRNFVVGDAFGAFQESPHGVDPQLELYFAEAEVGLRSPWLVSLLGDP